MALVVHGPASCRSRAEPGRRDGSIRPSSGRALSTSKSLLSPPPSQISTLVRISGTTALERPSAMRLTCAFHFSSTFLLPRASPPLDHWCKTSTTNHTPSYVSLSPYIFSPFLRASGNDSQRLAAAARH